MDIHYSTNRKLIRMCANVLSIFVILAMAFPAAGSVSAQEESPYLRAFPDQNFVDGSGWPAGQPVYLDINGNGFDANANENGEVAFDLAGFDLARGDALTMSSGDISVTYTVRQLFIADIDLDTQIVSGTVDGQQTVHLWVGEAADEYVDSDEDGNWSVDLSDYEEAVLTLGTCGNAEAWGDENSASSTIVDWCGPMQRDEFNGSLGEGWSWINENREKWNFNDGFLRIYAAPYGTGSENLLLRPVADGDFMIKTRLLFEPHTNYQFAGLVIWQDEYNFLQLGRAFCDVEGSCVGNGLYFDRAEGGNPVDSNFATSIDNPSDVFLRLERRGDMVRAFYSIDEGISWYEIGTHWLPDGFQVNGVGLTASQSYDLNIPADFDFFELTEGWGFLPEGFHDYDQGDVPSWACNAGGWAVDPDNREADVNIEVVVDDQTVANLVAGEFRQDLQDAGVCVDGNCSFSTSLWGAISSYEPHRVDAWAQDDTGEWVLLSNSAKTLTCRTYDIYAYDPLTGINQQITDLRDTDEYDPSWSPNGKKIAHDVVYSDGSHGIYVTDVKTGISSPLQGAENGGNDAAWSPNGKWIAFDRRWYGDPNIYVVPDVGGSPTLVRSDAVTANWAPNSKRIVFQQLSDGSVWTAPADGGKGDATFITSNGSEPAWSPDENWIAYVADGNIWKIPVNIQGKVLGEPIQVTHLSAWNVGGPTWSLDSQTIFFNAGVSDDIDLWSVPAAGGEITWLNGVPVFGEYGPANARNSSVIAYAGFSPDGQAARTWVAAFTYDLPAGYWTEGTHTYLFEASGLDNTPDFSFDVGNDKRLYDGTVLLRPGDLRARTGEDCFSIDAINPAQPTQFHVGWTADGTYADALTYFENFMAKVVWDGGAPVDLVQHEIFPLTPPVDWFGYTCTFTAGPPVPTFVAYIPSAIEGYDWPMGDEIKVTINDVDYPLTAFSEQRPDSPEGSTRVLFELWREGVSFKAGDHIVMTDINTGITKDVTVTNLAVTDFDLVAGTVSGIYDPNYSLWVWLYDVDGQVPATDPENGTWVATFDPLPPGSMGGATQWEEDGDGTSLDFQVPSP